VSSSKNLAKITPKNLHLKNKIGQKNDKCFGKERKTHDDDDDDDDVSID
jgi:hypothetical protein